LPLHPVSFSAAEPPCHRGRAPIRDRLSFLPSLFPFMTQRQR